MLMIGRFRINISTAVQFHWLPHKYLSPLIYHWLYHWLWFTFGWKKKVEVNYIEKKVSVSEDRILDKFPELCDALNLFLVYADRDGTITLWRLQRVKDRLEVDREDLHEQNISALEETIRVSEAFHKLISPVVIRKNAKGLSLNEVREEIAESKKKVRTWAKEQRVKYGFIDSSRAQIS